MRNKEDLLYDFYLKGKTNMAKATTKAPYAFVIPANGCDNVDVTDLINTLLVGRHIEVDRAAAPFTADGCRPRDSAGSRCALSFRIHGRFHVLLEFFDRRRQMG